MLDYPKALRATGLALLLCLVWLGGWILVFLMAFNATGFYVDPVFLGCIIIGAGVVLSAVAMIRGFLRRKPHIAYASLHAIGWMVFIGLAFLSNTSWLLASPLVYSIILFIFLQPILTILSKIQIVVHSAPKGATQDSPAYEQEYQMMQSGSMHPDEMSQKTEFGRYYSGK